MMIRNWFARLAFTLLAVLFVIGSASPAIADYPPAETHPLFEGDAVHEIHLTFSQTDWWSQLEDNFEGLDDPLYLEADFDWGGIHLDDIGVRFKGSSSYYNNDTDKKSFKLDLNEFVDDQELHGVDKLNLNCNYLDPSGVRETCMYELCDAIGLPTERTSYAALYINGGYWGLYTIVEQFDKEFIESRFGDDEDGNLWKGDEYGTLEYLGTDPESYYENYELKTNETANDWSALIELTDGLNNTAIGDLPEVMHELIDVNSALALIAVDNLCVNLDTYIGRCCNYYLYHRDLDSRFVFANWDLNESFGTFDQYGLSVTQMKQLSPYWVNPQSGEERPLAERLWQVDAYDDIYIGHLQKLMATAADPDTLIDRMEELRTLIQPYVYAEVSPRRMFTNTEFDNAMSSDQYVDSGGGGGRLVPGLEGLIRDRDTWLSSQIGTWTPIEGLVINELMASNSGTIADELGDFDDWIEIYNGGTTAISLSGLALTDDLSNPTAYTFPAATIAPGEYILVWADEEPAQGDYHADFKLKSEGEPVYLLDGNVIVDDTTWQPLDPDVSWGRWPNGAGDFQVLGTATPGAPNDNNLTGAAILTGPGPGDDNAPLVRAFPPEEDAAHRSEFYAYGADRYGVNVTAGDVDGDLLDEVITGAGPGTIYGPHVRGFTTGGTAINGLNFLAYGTNKWGVNVAAGDIDGDSYDEIITGAGPGAVFGPHVRAFDFDGSGSVTPVSGVSYFAYGTPKWGVNVAAGDIDGDGYDEIVSGAGPGAVYGPHVRGWNVDGGAAASIPGLSFLAYGTNKYGVNVTCGDMDGDGIDEIVTGAGPGAVFGAHVRGWNYDGSALESITAINFFAWPSEEARYGAKVFAGADLDHDGSDELVVGAGPDPDIGSPVNVYQLDGSQVELLFSLQAYPDGWTEGVSVAAGNF